MNSICHTLNNTICIVFAFIIDNIWIGLDNILIYLYSFFVVVVFLTKFTSKV